MPKKRHQARYSKPQSTAPASLSISSTATAGAGISSNRSNRSSRGSITSSLSSSSSSAQNDPPTPLGVNDLLAHLRSVRLSAGARPEPISQQPTLPPNIRSILQLPELPPPRPRRLLRIDSSGRRLPPGPAPPQSWVSTAARQVALRQALQYGGRDGRARERRPLPGCYVPGEGSLVDAVLRRMVVDWDFQKEYCRYVLYDLPTHLRVALIAYLGVWADGVTIQDLGMVLTPPPPEEEDGEGEEGEVQVAVASPGGHMNLDFHHLDLTGSLGHSLKLRELSSFLFPSRPESTDLQDSWDAPEEESAINVPRPLLPNLTHLSLGINPDYAHAVSWRHLVAFASHHAKLTHLSLAFWPEPAMTPNAKLASFVTAQGRSVQYGGTGPYSHSLDNDWAEAIVVLRRLSKSLYGLEYLDLTGCGEWISALWSHADHDAVDWVGDWGKISTLLLYPGYQLGDDADVAETARYWEIVQNAERVERHIRAKRAGRGRFITVETARRE